MNASWRLYKLEFKKPAGTSRGTLHHKPSYFIRAEKDGRVGFGECAVLPGLSVDDRPEYVERLDQSCSDFSSGMDALELLNGLADWPSIRFGWEMTLAELGMIDLGNWQQTSFERGEAGIPINGLVWMGDLDYQRKQLHELYERGFRVIKFKIGKDLFSGGFALLEEARELDPDLEIRVDANGAYGVREALEVMEELVDLQIHSIEQPIAPGKWREMGKLVERALVPIALDEELIFCPPDKRSELIDTIDPDYLILKPSLLGGWSVADTWAKMADDLGIGYWTTSALESMLGLQWIGRFAATHPAPMVQGLGTGSLYINNLPSDLEIRDQALWRSKPEERTQSMEAAWGEMKTPPK